MGHGTCGLALGFPTLILDDLRQVFLSRLQCPHLENEGAGHSGVCGASPTLSESALPLEFVEVRVEETDPQVFPLNMGPLGSICLQHGKERS